MFGPSELTLRLPSLLGGMLYGLSASAIMRSGNRKQAALDLAALAGPALAVAALINAAPLSHASRSNFAIG